VIRMEEFQIVDFRLQIERASKPAICVQKSAMV
jgi:hypothetical protein